MTRLVAFLALPAALAAGADDQAAADRAAADRLKELGAQVTVADGAVTKIVFRDCSKLGEAEYRLIGGLARLRSLTLYGGCKTLDDKTIVHLGGLQALEELGTDGMQLTDEGFRRLAGLRALRTLSLFHPSLRLKGFTGAGLAHLAALPKLERLTYAGTSAGDDADAAAAKLPHLTTLRTWHTYSTPAGVRHLAGMTKLKHLTLGQRLRRYDGGSNAPSLTDATVAELAALADLETLELDEARLTFAGLQALQRLGKLKKLTLKRIDIPAGDVEKLKAAMPGVTVTWTPLTDEERRKLDGYLAP